MPTRMKSEERRAAIVRSAIRLFAEKGFRGATTRELAAALGVTEPVLYQHFSTKRALYSAIIEAKCEEASARASELAALARRDDDRAFFTLLADMVLSRYLDDPDTVRLLLFSALERHELSEMFFDRLIHEFSDLVAGYIRRRMRADAFRKVNPESAARGIIGMVAYQGLMGMLFPGRVAAPNRKRVAEEMVSVFLKGIEQKG